MAEQLPHDPKFEGSNPANEKRNGGKRTCILALTLSPDDLLKDERLLLVPRLRRLNRFDSVGGRIAGKAVGNRFFTLLADRLDRFFNFRPDRRRRFRFRRPGNRLFWLLGFRFRNRFRYRFQNRFRYRFQNRFWPCNNVAKTFFSVTNEGE